MVLPYVDAFIPNNNEGAVVSEFLTTSTDE